MIPWILISPNGPTKMTYIKILYVEVHSTIIEFENRKAKQTHYFVQVVGLDDLNGQ